MRRTTAALAVFVFASTLAPLRGEPNEYDRILAGMRRLAPLVGTWDAVWKFHERDGNVSERVGTHTIAPVLDGTYLAWSVEQHRKGEAARGPRFMIYTTFDPRKNRYDQTYFYSRWALRVTETGDFDDAARAFRTTAFIPKEDDVHDENVRTILTFADSRHAVYRHWSRYDNEPVERLDLEIELTRSR